MKRAQLLIDSDGACNAFLAVLLTVALLDQQRPAQLLFFFTVRYERPEEDSGQPHPC